MEIDRAKLIEAALASHDYDVVSAIYKVIMSPYYSFVPRPDQPELHDQQSSFVNDQFNGIAIALGGNGCLAGEQELYDPVTGISTPVGKIKSPSHVWSRDEDGNKVIGMASTPFVKGTADIYEVKLSNGSSFRCTLEHRVLTPNGFVSLKNLSVGNPLLTSSDTYHSCVYITKINFLRTDIFYDLTVPIYHNYECAGTWHHNSGKSMAGAFKFAKFLRETPPPEKQTKAWVISQTMEMAVGVCWVEHLEKFLPDAIITGWYNMKRAHPRTVQVKHTNGNSWIIEFRSVDMGREALQGSSVGCWWIDEQAPLSLIAEIDARSRNHHYSGNKIYTLTPLTPDTDLERLYNEQEKNPEYKFYRMNSECNTTINLSFLESCPDFERETRAYGSFASYTGSIYKSFNSEHVIEPFEIDPNWERVGGVDFGWDHPTVYLQAAKSPSGKFYVTNEYYQNKNSIEEHIEVIKSLHKKGDIWADQAAAQERHEYSIRGLPTRMAHKDVMAGIARIQQLLRKGNDQKPGLLIFNTCENLIREMRTYHWNPNIPNLPWKRGDDACFVAGTKIETNTGPKNIEDVKIGDYALTRMGYHKVVDASMTGYRKVLNVSFSNGKIITGTPNHPIWVVGKGWMPIEKLNINDKVITCQELKPSTSTQKLLAAHDHVVAVWEEKKQEMPVFNLTVEEQHEFFANNVLVHNCDALRYLIFSDGAQYAPVVKNINKDAYFKDYIYTNTRNPEGNRTRRPFDNRGK